MRRLVPALLLAALCGPAAADWVLLGAVPEGRSPTGAYSVYADPATVVRTGDTVSLSFLMDFKSAQRASASADARSYSSQTFQWQFHCKDRLWRTLASSAHAGHMAGGEVVDPGDGRQGDWQPVPPTTLMEVYWKLACARS